MTDALLERLSARAPQAVRSKLTPIPWPSKTAPQVVRTNRDPNSPLPKVDVVVSTYTAAEGQALADVLSPGLELDRWTTYAHNFRDFEQDLTNRSPAREWRCLGQYAVVVIGDRTVLLLRNELHLATDSVALPLRRAWRQMIQESRPDLWIDTGTAGGIGPNVVEGDSVVATDLVFDCTSQFKGESWAHSSYPCTATVPSDWSAAEALMKSNARLLHPEAARDPRVWADHDVITCDSFLFDDTEDSFGLETYDKSRALVEEMDAAVLGLVAQDIGAAMPSFTSLRSVSDPQMPKGQSIEAEKRAASAIYLRYGYAAQVATLCAVHQVIADR